MESEFVFGFFLCSVCCCSTDAFLHSNAGGFCTVEMNFRSQSSVACKHLALNKTCGVLVVQDLHSGKIIRDKLLPYKSGEEMKKLPGKDTQCKLPQVLREKPG